VTVAPFNEFNDAYELSAFPELLKAWQEWNYTVKDLKELGLLVKEDK
jgi:hypothetical protein